MLIPRKSQGKSYIEMMEENISKIPILTDEWTNYNPSDPGMTILEYLTAAIAAQKEKINDVPIKVKTAMLGMMGFKPEKSKGAKLYLQAPEGLEGTRLPADFRFSVENLSYETTHPCMIPNAHITELYLYKNDGREPIDLSLVLDSSIPIKSEIWTAAPESGMYLMFVTDKALTVGEKVYFQVEVDNTYNRNHILEANYHETYTGEIMALVTWEMYTADGFKELKVQDDTVCFLQSGVISFTPQQEGALYQDEAVSGYCFRAKLNYASYDLPPAVRNITDFVFPIVQKESLATSASFDKASEVTFYANNLEECYILVFIKESKGSTYKKYEEYNPNIMPADTKGRLFLREDKGDYCTIRLDKERFGYGPVSGRNAIKILCYNQEIMRKFELGKALGYDNQEIKLPREHIVPGTFSLLARRKDKDGGYIYDFVKPGKMDPDSMSYYLFDNEGKIIILDSGKFVGADLFMGSIAVTLGPEGSVRNLTRFTGQGELSKYSFYNPNPGEPGSFRDSFEGVRLKLVDDISTPYTAVKAQDYEYLVKNMQGLCISKVKAWLDSVNNEVKLAILVESKDEYPAIPEFYQSSILSYLEDRRLLGTRVSLSKTVYCKVDVEVNIAVKPHYTDVNKRITALVTKHIDYRKGEQNFGDVLVCDDIFTDIEQVEGVDYISSIKLTSRNPQFAVPNGADLHPIDSCLLVPGEIIVYQVVSR